MPPESNILSRFEGVSTGMILYGKLFKKTKQPLWRLYRSSSTLSGDPTPDPDKVCQVNEKIVLADGIRWRRRGFYLHTLPFYYSSISKFRLTAFVTLTTLGGSVIAPGFSNLGAVTAVCLGSFLCSSSANTFNQIFEYPHDAQMNRTKKRPLPSCAVSIPHAFSFGIISGILGTYIIALYTNPLTVTLSLINIIFYVLLYTPMKQKSIYNTHVGSIVGALPPLGGYIAVSGGFDLPCFMLPLIMYAWQFPHFNSLSWLLRHDYAKAGYVMMVNQDLDMLKKSTINYALFLTVLSGLIPLSGLVNPAFAVTSLVPNIALVHASWKFTRNMNNASALYLFKVCLIQLGVLIGLIFVHKKKVETKES